MMTMNKIVELPLEEPVYSTYHYQGPGTAVIANNTSIRNWYLNKIMILTCNCKFLSGFTTPEIGIEYSSYPDNPYLNKNWFSSEYLNGHINTVIKNLLDAGYYVCFGGIDDYYIKGKSWYKERHFDHDGLICGYNREDKTYCIYAYDSNWIYKKFWTPQSCFEAGRKAMRKKGVYTGICAIKPLEEKVEFCAETAINTISEYLDSSLEKYPEEGNGKVRGIVVHEYIAKYAGMLVDGSIPYEKMDRRVFRLIWEHKKVMLERIQCIEKALGMQPDISQKYTPIVKEADNMRMLYASHHMHRRDSLLPIIQKKLLAVKAEEEKLLKELLEKTGGVKAQ